MGVCYTGSSWWSDKFDPTLVSFMVLVFSLYLIVVNFNAFMFMILWHCKSLVVTLGSEMDSV